MNHKNNLHIVLVVITIVLLGIGSYFVFTERTGSPLPTTESPLTPYLTTDMALSLLQEKELLFFAGCALEGDLYNYQSCIIETEPTQEKNQWIATIIYDGLFDDSVRAIKIRAIIAHQDNQWVVKESSETQKCQPNRGHQYFSAELCI